MNISLAIWVRDNVRDLSTLAKSALVAIATHCRQDDHTAAVSYRRIAVDLSCHLDTVRRALYEAMGAGYVVVENQATDHSPTVWGLQIADSKMRGGGSKLQRVGVADTQNADSKMRALWLKEGVKSWGGDAPLRPNGRATPPVENTTPPRTFAEVQAEEQRRQAERDAIVAKLVDDAEPRHPTNGSRP